MNVELRRGSQIVVRDQWLSEMLGYETYQLNIGGVSIQRQDLDVLQELQRGPVFIYSKVGVDQAENTLVLEDYQFHLVDTNIVLKKKAERTREFKGNAHIRFAVPEDEDNVVELARHGFRFSRFHLDKTFSNDVANLIKAEWVRNYFKGKRGKYMIVAIVDNFFAGFLQLLSDDKGTLTIDLIAVGQEYHQQGIATDMIQYAQDHCKNVCCVRVGTQIANIPSMRLYEKLGFRTEHASYVYHYHNKFEK